MIVSCIPLPSLNLSWLCNSANLQTVSWHHDGHELHKKTACGTCRHISPACLWALTGDPERSLCMVAKSTVQSVAKTFEIPLLCMGTTLSPSPVIHDKFHLADAACARWCHMAHGLLAWWVQVAEACYTILDGQHPHFKCASCILSHRAAVITPGEAACRAPQSPFPIPLSNPLFQSPFPFPIPSLGPSTSCHFLSATWLH